MNLPVPLECSTNLIRNKVDSDSDVHEKKTPIEIGVFRICRNGNLPSVDKVDGNFCRAKFAEQIPRAKRIETRRAGAKR